LIVGDDRRAEILVPMQDLLVGLLFLLACHGVSFPIMFHA
jgi:hypothetical protein